MRELPKTRDDILCWKLEHGDPDEAFISRIMNYDYVDIEHEVEILNWILYCMNNFPDLVETFVHSTFNRAVSVYLAGSFVGIVQQPSMTDNRQTIVDKIFQAAMVDNND